MHRNRSRAARYAFLRRSRFRGLILALLGVCLSALPAAAQTAQNTDLALRSITGERLRGHLLFLADDLLEGRAPGTTGGRIAGRYIASHFERAGLKPPSYGWYQPVPLHGWKPLADRIGLEFAATGRRVPLRYPADAVLWTTAGAAAAEVEADVVFVGYGVVAPEYDWDDFGDADLRGKVLLFLAGDPPASPEEPDRFDGAAMTWYGRWTYKVEQALRLGAAGALLVHSDDGAGYAWDVVRASWTGEQFYPAATREPESATAGIEGWIRFESARFTLGAAGLNLRELIARASQRGFQPMETGLTVRARAAGTIRRLETANVVGILPGRHPTRRDEAVVYTAHYDHFGIGPAVAGDSIYNGAYDNASGVAVLIELANAFGMLRPPPDRTLIFVATAAEEAGLLGAQRYVQSPVIAMDRTAAVINIDGANLWGETWDVAAVGAERSTLGAIAADKARELGMRLSPERAADRGLFFRSDHFPFARAGVPALYIEHGLEYRDRPTGWGAATLGRYETERYHRPGDQFDPAFDLAGAVQQARFAFLIGLDVARRRDRPRYNDDSEFQRVRTRQAGR